MNVISYNDAYPQFRLSMRCLKDVCKTYILEGADSADLHGCLLVYNPVSFTMVHMYPIKKELLDLKILLCYLPVRCSSHNIEVYGFV